MNADIILIDTFFDEQESLKNNTYCKSYLLNEIREENEDKSDDGNWIFHMIDEITMDKSIMIYS